MSGRTRSCTQARRDLERANEESRLQNSLVGESRERMLQAHQTAKRAVAEELHGSVQTKLYAVWVRLAALAKRLESGGSDVAEEIGSLTDEIDKIREQDIRMLSRRLHPSVIRLGLGTRLRSLRDYYEHVLDHAGDRRGGSRARASGRVGNPGGGFPRAVPNRRAGSGQCV